MKTKKKIAPDVASIESGAENTESMEALGCSLVHNTTPMPTVQGTADILPRRAENMASSKALALICTIRPARAALRVIEGQARIKDRIYGGEVSYG